MVLTHFKASHFVCKWFRNFECHQLLLKYSPNPLCKHSSTQKNCKTFLKEKIAFSFQFSLLEQETVFKIIDTINSKHSCGHDDISNIFMKKMPSYIITNHLNPPAPPTPTPEKCDEKRLAISKYYSVAILMSANNSKDRHTKSISHSACLYSWKCGHHKWCIPSLAQRDFLEIILWYHLMYSFHTHEGCDKWIHETSLFQMVCCSPAGTRDLQNWVVGTLMCRSTNSAGWSPTTPSWQ